MGSYPAVGNHGLGVEGAVSTFEEQVEMIRQGFEFEYCPECGGDLGDHIIAPDALGNAHAWCQRNGEPR